MDYINYYIIKYNAIDVLIYIMFSYIFENISKHEFGENITNIIINNIF